MHTFIIYTVLLALKRFHVKFKYLNCLGYYLSHIVSLGGDLKTHAQGLFVCKKNSTEQFWRIIFLRSFKRN